VFENALRAACLAPVDYGGVAGFIGQLEAQVPSVNTHIFRPYQDIVIVAGLLDLLTLDKVPGWLHGNERVMGALRSMSRAVFQTFGSPDKALDTWHDFDFIIAAAKCGLPESEDRPSMAHFLASLTPDPVVPGPPALVNLTFLMTVLGNYSPPWWARTSRDITAHMRNASNIVANAYGQRSKPFEHWNVLDVMVAAQRTTIPDHPDANRLWEKLKKAQAVGNPHRCSEEVDMALAAIGTSTWKFTSMNGYIGQFNYWRRRSGRGAGAGAGAGAS